MRAKVTSSSMRYGGLDCTKSHSNFRSKFTVPQQIKLNKIIENLNTRLLNDNYPDGQRPYKQRDTYRILRNLSNELGTDDVDTLITELKERCVKTNYRIKL